MRQSDSTALQQAANAVPAIVPFRFNYISKLQNFQKIMKDMFGEGDFMWLAIIFRQQCDP
jgi:hypothetical protein